MLIGSGKKNPIKYNYISSAANMLVPLLALPFYVDRLGPVQWGMLSFVLAMLALAQTIEVGWGQSVLREISAMQKNAAYYVFLSGVQRLYWKVSLFLTVSIILCSGVVAENWLKLSFSDLITARLAISIASVQIGLSLPNSFYRAVLISVENQIELSKANILIILAKHGLAVFALFFWENVILIASIYSAISLVEVGLKFFLAKHYLRYPQGISKDHLIDDWEIVRKLSKLSIPITLSVLVSQADKIVLSACLDISSFGLYSIAASLAVGATQIAYPVLQAYMPSLYASSKYSRERVEINKKIASLLLIQLIIVLSAYYLFGEGLIRFWIKSDSVANSVVAILDIMMIGTGLNFFYNFFYNNWIANADSKSVFLSSSVAGLLILLVAPISIAQYGIKAAGGSWIAINLTGVAVGVYFMLKKRP